MLKPKSKQKLQACSWGHQEGYFLIDIALSHRQVEYIEHVSFVEIYDLELA